MVFKANLVFDLTREREAIHSRHFRVGKNQGDLIVYGFTLGFGLLGDAVQRVPSLLTGFRHDQGNAHGFQTLFNQAARKSRVVGRENFRTRAQRYLGAYRRGIDFWLAGRQHFAQQDLFHIQHLNQAGMIGICVELGDTGYQAALGVIFCGNDLIPFQANDLFHGLYGKSLGGA